MATSPAAREDWRGLDLLVLTPVPTHPPTLGNRVRIAEVCRVLAARGARITLLHYPTDESWRERLPEADHAAMRAAFNEVQLIPVTRPLHTAPQPGPDHTIDEWWDPAIGTMLDWLFSVRRFDAFLVNYTWLSRALEHAPPGVVRILDTHDRFADRRALLGAHGIAPEYFFTTPEQEAIGIARADLVWAIKPEEAAYFRMLGARQVVTVPHAEMPRFLPPRQHGWRDGAPVLRLGIAGGRNTINAENIRRFLDTLRETLRRTLHPIEIVIAGSVCDLIGDRASSWVTLLGGVETMDELYGAVDAVMLPIAFSTGLKIRAGEAMARGKALIAHAHGFEGYRPSHAFHQCADFAAMARAIEAIVHDPSLLDTLEEASRETIVRARLRMEGAIAHTGAPIRAGRRSVAILADAAALRPDCLVFDHVREAASVLGAASAVSFHPQGASAAAERGCLGTLARLGAIADSAPASDAVLYASLPEALPQITTAPAPVLGIAHLDILALAAAPEEIEARLAALARRCARFLLLSQAPSALAARIVAAADDGSGRVRALTAPFLARDHDSPLLRALHKAPADGMMVLAERGAAPEVSAVLAFLIRGLRLRPTLIAADSAVPDSEADGPLGLPGGALLHAPPGALFDPLTYRRARPSFVAEIGAAPGFAAAREIFSRARIPMARLFDPLAEPETALRAEAHARGRGMFSAFLILDHLARNGQGFGPAFHAEAEAERGHSAGWAAVQEAIAAIRPPV